MWRLFYNLFFPVGVLFFLPGLWWKYRTRPGWKATFCERFGKFSPERVEELKDFHGALWIHAVSVGETVVALSMIKAYLAANPERRAVLSTTTTTGQELARKQVPERTAVIFCPIDFVSFVRRTFDVIKPSGLVIFETEIWPNMIAGAKKRGIPVALVNARMSDRSARGYSRFRCFFAPLLKMFDVIAAQSEADAQRYLAVSPEAHVVVTGNMKFDQNVPEDLPGIDLKYAFGEGEFTVIAAASTHPGEEELIAGVFKNLRREFAFLRLLIIPRHAERGGEIASVLEAGDLPYVRRSMASVPEKPVEVLLADTTGEMLKLMKSSDIVIMGKSLAGHDEGHNLIEPALLGKPVVCGNVLTNFRFVLNILKEADGVCTVSDEGLENALRELISAPGKRLALGERGQQAIRRHSGAIGRTIAELDRMMV